MVAPALVLGLRGVQVLFSIIVLGLSAYLVDAYVGWTPASVAFMLFTSIWTLLAVAYLILAPMRFPAAAHKFAIAAVEFVTMVFWFAAFVAVAARWSGYWWVGRHSTFHNAGVAAIVFGAFTWLTFVITTVLSALHIRSAPRNDTTAQPSMAMA
ncbi:MARVEL-like domain [Pyrenophora seminiperda CCB06]|uniref:MARVEL-like domain n=1 Tax=Pyrenophora seminiperda CCB06 TaxID=1302712 RepID=A0A3M7M8H9_9PLEO|nr:MARVEL-like domain [Pyrenophora seminiperda CCB06]